MMSAMNLNQAITLARNGEESGYRWLYQQYADSIQHLFQYGFRFSPDVSEDMLQETFIDAFCALNTLRHVDRFGAWIHTIARHKAIRRLKKDRKTSLWFDQYIREFSTLHVQSGDQSERLVQLVKHIIDTLPEGSLKECARLYYCEEHCTVDEVAKKQGTTRGTITSRLKRFRRKIRKKLAKKIEDMAHVD